MPHGPDTVCTTEPIVGASDGSQAIRPHRRAGARWRLPWNTIQGQLAALLLVLMVVISAAGLVVVQVSTSAMVRSYGEQTRELAYVILRQIDSVVAGRIAELSLFGNDRLIAPMLAEALPSEAGVVVGTSPLPPDRSEAVRAQAGQGAAIAQHLIDRLEGLNSRAYGQQVYGDVVLADRHGRVIAASLPSAVAVLAAPDVLAEALAHGHAIRNRTDLNDDLLPGWTVAVRLEDRQGRVAGVVATVVSSQWVVREAATRSHRADDLEVRLTDGRGRLIHSSRPFAFMADISGQPVYSVLHAQDGYAIVPDYGRDRLYAVSELAPGTLVGDLGWHLFLGGEAARILAPVDRLRGALLLVASGLGILVAAIVAFAGHKLSRPVLALRDAAERLRAGDLTVRARVSTGAEIGALAGSFNAMVDQLATTQTLLHREIAVRRQAEAALREQATFVSNVLDSLTHSAAVVDPEGTIVAVNRTWITFSEANGAGQGDPSVAAGTSYFRQCDPAAGDITGADEAYDGIRLVQSGQLPRFELEYPCHSPSEQHWFVMAVVPLKDRPGHVLISHNDITALKRAQIALQDKNATLAEEIRLRQAYEEALLAERDRSDAANRAKSEFLANMSHELRTPLNAIIGFSEIIKEQVFGPVENQRYREYAENIHGSGNHLLSLINDLLDLSKIEAGKMELDEEAFDLAELAEEAATMVADQLEQSGLVLRRALPAGHVVWADRRKLKQVLLNLLSNAIKFSSQGAEVELSVGETADGHPFLTVRDHGIGMAPEDLDRALSLFGQTEVGRAAGGTGLGLPLARQLVGLHGGELVFDTAPGVGTQATARLPTRRRYRSAPAVLPRGRAASLAL